MDPKYQCEFCGKPWAEHGDAEAADCTRHIDERKELEGSRR